MYLHLVILVIIFFLSLDQTHTCFGYMFIQSFIGFQIMYFLWRK